MMNRLRTWMVAGALALAATTTACNDFLTGGELTTDPNRPTSATMDRLFAGIQAGVWGLHLSDMARVTGMWAQQWEGVDRQYLAIQQYSFTESATNGFQAGLYSAGGLIDARRLQQMARAANDSIYLGIAQVQEALIMGAGADLFGDLTYTEALKGTLNPKLDPQMTIYDAIQALLTDAIRNLGARRGGTNVGPRAADLAYGGSAGSWSRLAHTLKARYFLHTAEVRPAAYASALAEAKLGLTDPAEDFNAVFSGNAGEENFWAQFQWVQRYYYMCADPDFVGLLEARSDPRVDTYYADCDNYDWGPRNDFAAAVPIASAAENLLIWAEAEYRAGNMANARTQLNAEREIAGLPPVAATLTGPALLTEILTEKYIATFQTIEPWNDYKRTCWPNLVPVTAGSKIPARLYYDTSERQTNSNIPAPSAQPTRNANDPANATDPLGNKCLGQ